MPDNKPKEFKSKDGKVICYEPFNDDIDFTEAVFVPSGQGRSSISNIPLVAPKSPKE